MLEIGVFHNGASSLPVVTTKEGVAVNDGSLEEVHRAAQETLVNQVRQGILAEKLGFQSFWLTEHHFQPEGAEISPNPLLTQMAIAAQTKKIRLGQCANIVVWHHPVRIAEQIAHARRDQRRPGRVRHRPRLPAARERDAGPALRLDDPGPGAQPQVVRGGRRDHRRSAGREPFVLAPRRELLDSADLHQVEPQADDRLFRAWTRPGARSRT